MSATFPIPSSARASALSLFAVWAIACSPALPAQTRAGHLPELLAPRVEPLGDPLSGKDAKILRSRAVEWNLELLRTLPREGGGRARVALFDDLAYEAVFEQREAFSVGGFGWVGRLEGLPGSEFTLAVVGEAVCATFNPLDGTPTDLCVRPSARGAFAREKERWGRCGTDALEPLSHGSPEGGSTCGDDGSLVTVLVAYTPAARSEAGGTSEIFTIGLNAVMRMNWYMQNSRVTEVRVDAVHFYETNYTEVCGGGTSNGIDTDYTRLRTENDGHLDDVIAQRLAVRADLATLLIDTNYWCNPETAGLGGVGGAYSVCVLGEIDYTLGHELGHNFGCGHHTSNSGMFSYGHGYRWFQAWPPGSYTTVMGYTDLIYARVPFFSTSDSHVTYQGHVVGDATHDNARVLRERRVATANFQATRDIPIIGRQPRATTICPGNNPSVTDVSAIWATSYQWFYNGASLPGANAEILSLPSATQAQSGFYFCRIGNACGSVDSSVVYIQVRQNCDVLYVDGSRPYPGGDGLSWGGAFWNLKQALDYARTLGTVREIRVASGTYAPTLPHFIPQRDLTHLVPNGMRIRGGYYPGGSAVPDPRVNPTVLTAVIGPGVLSHHVLTAFNTGFDMQLEGLTIEGGAADGNVYERRRGGALHQIGGDLTILDCTIRSNYAVENGGAICAENANVRIENCIFENNSAEGGGGAIATFGGAISINACQFRDNASTFNAGGVQALGDATVTSSLFCGNQGAVGAIAAWTGTAVLANLTVYGNRGTGGAGGVELTVGRLANSILWGNTGTGTLLAAQVRSIASQVSFCCIEGLTAGWGGAGNIAADPELENAGNRDFHIRPTSPCIDGGTLAALSLPPIDFEGDPRVDRNGQVDIGCDEARGERLRYLGTGCAGDFVVAGSLRLGGSITMYCNAAYPVASLYLGVSDRAWFGLPLPFPISQSLFGTCSLEISPDVLVYSGPIAVFPNLSTLSFPIPADPALAGPELFLQWHSWMPGLSLDAYRTTRAAGVRFGL